MSDLPIYGPPAAECSKCELKENCDRNLWVPAFSPPENFNGLMLIGEAPGGDEIRRKEPFVGRAGELLRALLDQAGIKRDECYLTTSVLCLPLAKAEGKTFHQQFPNAIYSCLPRLEAEIQAVRPRVIVGLGSAALIALTGYEVIKHHREPFECPDCDNLTRKVGPYICCTATTKDGEKCTYKVAEGKIVPATCPNCSAKLKNQKPKLIPCFTCHGKKTKEVESVTFKHDYRIGEVAGGIFPTKKLAAPFAQWGVEYVVCTYSPGYVLRPPPKDSRVMAGQFAADAVIHHFRKAKWLLDHDANWFANAIITTDPRDVYDCLDPKINWAVDIETEAYAEEEIDEESGDTAVVQKDARDAWAVTDIKCIGIGHADTEDQIVVDTRGLVRGTPLHTALVRFLGDPKIHKTFQNGIYDTTVIRRLWGIKTEGYTDDILIAHHNLAPDEDHNLAHQTFEFLPAEVWKPAKVQKGVQVHEDFDELAIYNARDVRNTAGVRQMYGVSGGKASDYGMLGRADLSDVYEIDMQMQRIACEMTFTGMPISKEAMNHAGIVAQRHSTDALMRMREFMNQPDFNPRSSKHLQWALYDRSGPLKLQPPSKTKSGVGSTAADDLAKLAHIPFVRDLLAYREHEKIDRTYIQGKQIKIREDGRVHPTWKVTGTRTGRWSSSPNFQNFPRWLRSICVPNEGRVIVGADYAQLEVRIMAALSGDADLIRRCATADEKRKLEPDYDPHSYVASLAFGRAFTDLALKAPEHIPKGSPGAESCKCDTCIRSSLREIAKTVVYGLNYGASPPTILAGIYARGYKGPPVSLEIIERTTQTFFKAFPGVVSWRNKTLQTACALREVRSPLLRRRRVFPLGDVPATVAYNYPIQSCAADIINQRLILLDKALAGVDPSARIIAQVHDAIYVECVEDKADKMKKLVSESLSWTLALAQGAPEMPFLASAKIGKNWSEVS